MREEGSSYVVTRLPPVQDRQVQPRTSSHSTRGQAERRARPADTESGYGTDTDRSDLYFCSPQVSPRSQFTPINKQLSPKSPFVIDYFNAISQVGARSHQALHTVTSAPVENGKGASRTKRTHSKVAFSDNCDDDHLNRPYTADTVDSCYSGRTSGGFSSDNGHARVDLDAAEVLLSLCATDHTQPPTKRTRHGSKY